jgi:HlyD family secretion protein
MVNNDFVRSKAMKRKKVLIIPVTAAVIVLSFICLGSVRRSKDAPAFRTAAIERGDLEILVSTTGTLSAVETVAVGAEVSGTIGKVYVDYNDTVIEGDTLALVEPAVFEASVSEAKASVLKAEAEVEKSRAEYERNKTLHEKGHISEFDLLILKTSLRSAEADLLSAEAKLVQAQNNLENTVIRSPVSGTVIERSVDAGQTIASSFQAPELFIIAKDLKEMQIEADVDENDIGKIEKDQKVRFTVQAYPDLSFDGVVRQVRLQPETIQNVVTYTVVIDVANDDGLLLPGMTATIDFIVLERQNTLLVPNSAISFQPMIPDKAPKQGGFLANLFKGKKNDGAPAMNKTTVPAGVARVFCLTTEGFPRAELFTPGESDGVFTEILETTNLEEGTQVITGASSQSRKEESVSHNTLFPMPGRPPR